MASVAASETSAPAANLTTPVAVFVGGTSGIGQGMAEAFNRHTKGAAHIVLVGRNRDAAEAIISNMKSVAGESSAGSYEFVPCDVSLLSNVKRCAADIAAKHPAIDFLLITAGVVAASRAPTAEGLDRTAVLHYYARWAFIHELLPALRAARDANRHPKVLSVFYAGRCYSAHDPATYNDLMCEEYALRNPGVVFAHAFPGGVRTNILAASDSALVRALGPLRARLQPRLVSQDACAEHLWRALRRCAAAAGSGGVVGAHRIGSRGEDLGMARYRGTPERRKALWARSASLARIVDP